MRTYRFSRAAEVDVQSIIAYTIEVWSFAQAEKYVAGLEAQCLRLARTPEIGKRADEVRPGLRSFLYQSHVIYYRITEAGINVIAVLHGRQGPALRFSDNDA